MFKTAEEAIAYIEGTRMKKYNVSSLKALLERYDNFHLKLRTIHVGGTNGKGSTVNFISSILIKSGYKVGTFTSPYLISHHDRIRINNVYISDDDLLDIVNRFYDDFEEARLTFFEMDTFIALYYFYINKVDFAVIEVGLGGRLDATNVIIPLVSIVTTIGYDHMKKLGNTYAEIAFEKAGIIKGNTPFYTSERKKECLDVFMMVCQERNAEFNLVDEPTNVRVGDEETRFDFQNDTYVIRGTALYQPYNASLSLSVARRIRQMGHDKITEETIREGLFDCFCLGRFEKLSSEPLIYIDAGHNLTAMETLNKTLQMYKDNGYHIRVIFSCLKDKDHHGMIRELLKVSDDLTVTEFKTIPSRQATAEMISEGLDVKVVPDFRKLYDDTYKIKDDKCLTIFVGSIYFISQVRAYHFSRRR